MPNGAAATPVVAKLTTTDTPTHTTDTNTIRYDCPRYSDELRGLVAWRHTWTTHQKATNRPASTEHVIRDVFPSGIVQPIWDEISCPGEDDKPPEVLRQTRSHYEPLSDGPFENSRSGTCCWAPRSPSVPGRVRDLDRQVWP